MDSKISLCTNKIISSFRLLEYSSIVAQFDEIEEALKGNTLDQENSDKIAALVLPIFYPGDGSNTRLKFSIQCKACSYLIRLSPDLQYDIIVSVMDIFQQYPHVFISNTSIKNVLIDFFFYVNDPWNLINTATQNHSNDFIWCFLLYCFDNIEHSQEKPNWDLVLQLVSDEGLFQSRKIIEILKFFEKVYHCWGPNPNLSSTLTNYSLHFIIKTADIPPFLYDTNSQAITLEEKTIHAISLHLSGSTPLTARSLSLISRQDGNFQCPIYQISLFLALLQTIPLNFKNILAQRIKSFIKRIEFTEKVAAHIVAAVSICKLNDFSIIDIFSDAYSEDEQKRSLFFAYLADCSQSLDLNSTIPLINDAFISVESSGPAYGVCKFISSLLNKCRLHTEILTESDIENMKKYLDFYISMVDEHCSASNVTIADIEKMIKLSSKIIAKLGLLCDQPSLLPLDQPSICQSYFTCSVCSASLSYSSDLPIPLDYACIAYIISKFKDFEEFSEKIKSHVCRILTTSEFPPSDFEFNLESGRTFYNISQKTFQFKSCPMNIFYKTILPFIPPLRNLRPILSNFINNFWTEKYYSDIPNNSISLLLPLYDNYDAFFKCFVAFLKNSPTIFFDQINNFLNTEYPFRAWLVSKFLSPCSLFFPNAFKIAKKIFLTTREFKYFVPSLKKVLPRTGNNGQTAVRASAVKFVGRYFDVCPPLTKYCLSTSINLLLRRSEDVEFPSNEELATFSEGDGGFDSSNSMLILTSELSGITYIDNRNAPSLELNASLNILTRAIENNSKLISDLELDSIHKSLRRSNDPRIRKSYLKFLASLGLKGITYASQISPNVPITPYF